MKTEKVFIPICVKDRMPEKANENYLTISEKGTQTARFFNGQRFETAHYEGEIAHWLEESELIVLTEEQASKLFPIETVMTAVEFGFLSHEKGNNKEKTMIDFKKLFNDK